MSVDKLVDSTQLDSDLTSVANAIRAKSGGSSQLAFPAGFVSEIGNIPSGGGGTPYDSNPAALGTASPGLSTYYSRGDHVHDYPTDLKNALLQLAAKVVYVDASGEDCYNALYDALYHVVQYSVTNTLTNCTTSNAAESTSSARPYSATLTASKGYTLEGATVSVTMGGNDITSTAYNNGVITIASVTGAIVITAEAVESGGAQYTGYTQIGSPTITDNILTVADGKFIKSNVTFSPGNSAWKVTIKYRNTTGSYASYTDLVGSVDGQNASYRSFLLESSSINGSSVSMYLSSNGSSWDIGAGNATQATDIPHGQNVWCWLELSFTGSAYVLKYSSDGETWTTGKTYSSSSRIVDGYAVAFGLKRNGFLQGEIDLAECKIWIGDTLYWSAV